MNFFKIQDCLTQLNKNFSAIAISETWLNEEQTSTVQIEGFDLYTINRSNKRGGGVALYIRSSYHSEIIRNMSFSIYNLTECVTVEIHFERAKNIIIGCVYRPPTTNIDAFNDKLSEL